MQIIYTTIDNHSVSVTRLNKFEMVMRFKYPYFGLTFPTTFQVYVRHDLPKIVIKSVLAHEYQHIKDRDRHLYLWTLEARAWYAGFMAQPFGFLLGILMSLTPERIKLYYNRIRKGF